MNLGHRSLACLDNRHGAQLRQLHEAGIALAAVLIQVMDNGPGVDDTEKIFDAFMTTKEKGMGMGMAVSRSIVEANGGRLGAENNLDGGATFNVALPVSSKREAH